MAGHANTVPLPDHDRVASGVSRVEVSRDLYGACSVVFSPAELRPFELRFQFQRVKEEEGRPRLLLISRTHGLRAGELADWTLGVNWYLNDYTRLMLNYNESEIDGGFNDGAQIKGLGLRAQVDW